MGISHHTGDITHTILNLSSHDRLILLALDEAWDEKEYVRKNTFPLKDNNAKSLLYSKYQVLFSQHKENRILFAGIDSNQIRELSRQSVLDNLDILGMQRVGITINKAGRIKKLNRIFEMVIKIIKGGLQ